MKSITVPIRGSGNKCNADAIYVVSHKGKKAFNNEETDCKTFKPEFIFIKGNQYFGYPLLFIVLIITIIFFIHIY